MIHDPMEQLWGIYNSGRRKGQFGSTFTKRSPIKFLTCYNFNIHGLQTLFKSYKDQKLEKYVISFNI